MVSAICFVRVLRESSGAADRHWRPIFDGKRALVAIAVD
jgi:hypothetical protein